MSNSFNLHETNPNIPSGSNGCLCHAVGGPDTGGPFIAFIGTETDNVLAPYPVLCANCAAQCAQLVGARFESSVTVKPPSRKLTQAKRSVDDGDGPTI